MASHRHPIEIVGIAHYAYCNIKCSYCFLQTQDPASFAAGLKPYSLLPAIRELIEGGHLAPNAIIDWGGGEPTSYPEFDELLSMLLDHGTFHYLHTNGTRFPVSVRCASRRVHVICSVDAGRPETYVRLKQKDYLERVWLVLEDYIRAGSPVSLKYIVKDENCEDADLESFIERAARIGVLELIVDIDYDFPIPNPAVVTALGRLRGAGAVGTASVAVRVHRRQLRAGARGCRARGRGLLGGMATPPRRVGRAARAGGGHDAGENRSWASSRTATP